MRRGHLAATVAAFAAAGISAGCGAKDPSTLHVANARIEAGATDVAPILRFVVDNGLDTDERLTRVTTPGIEAVVTLDGDTDTSQASNPVDLPAGDTARFEAGDRLATISGLRRPLEPGDQLPVTFEFEHGVKITIDAPVVEPGTPGTDEDHR